MTGTVFVTGATGVVGPFLVRELIGRGWAVRVLARRPQAAPPGTEVVAGSLSDPGALARGVEGADAVVHLAALLHVNDPAPDVQAQYRVVNVEGTRLLAEAARLAGVGRFVYASTINVYGATRPGEVRTEGDAPAPASRYAQTKLEGETFVRALPGGVVLRLGAVYGPGMKGNYPLLARLLGLGVPVMVGDGTNRRSLVYAADAARALALAAEHPDAPGGLYNVTDGELPTFDTIARTLQRAAGRRPGLAYVPAAPIRAVLSGLQRVAQRVGLRFPGPLLLDKLTEDVAVSSRRIRDELGFESQVALEDGMAQALAPSARPHAS